jgi:hypothetical protein
MKMRRARCTILEGNTIVSPTTVPVHASSLPASPAPPRRRLVAALLLALAPFGANAATIAVTSPDDTDSAVFGTCTLRQAIMSMDVGGLVAACHKTGAGFGVDDTITFAESALTGAMTPGTVTLADSADPNGGIGGTLLVTAPNLTIDGSAWRGSGAGQYADGVTIARPDGATNRFGILRNSAPAGSRLALASVAIRNGHALEPLCDGGREGGGICMEAADLSMSDCRISGNQAAIGGGGIASATGSVTIERCTIDHNLAYLGGGIDAGSGTVTVTSSTIDANGEWGTSHGGGVHAAGTLVVVDSTISGNNGKLGAGLDVAGTLSLTRSLVTGNQAYYSGGGLHVLAGAVVTIAASTIAGNFARYVGGGVYAEGTLDAGNSTLAANAARDGGGIFLTATATLRLEHATLSLNAANFTGGGVGGSGSATIEHSIVSANTAGTGADIGAGVGWTGTTNLVSATSVDLGPLQDNGGPTQTMLPGSGSAAIDAIATADCVQPTDQRGIARPQGAGCDIGAVEVASDGIFADGFE